MLEFFRSKILWVPSVVFKTDSYVDIRNLSYKSLEAPMRDGDQKDVPLANIWKDVLLYML